MNERELAEAFLRWLNGEEVGFDPDAQIAAAVEADLMFAGPMTSREELVKMVEITGKGLDLQILATASDGERTALMYELVDEVTMLHHRCAMFVSVVDGQVVAAMRVSSQGWPGPDR